MGLIETDRVGDVGVLTLARPPVNAFNLALRRALFEAIGQMDDDPAVVAVVLRGSGRGFSAGGDIHEFGSPDASAAPGLSKDIHARIEACRKPIIAAVHGICLGGGLETALACHWRIAVASARVGLPEVSVGTLPLSGTQRLPRALGLRLAAQLIAAGEVFAASAHPALFDELVQEADEEVLLQHAVALARSVQSRPDRMRLLRHQPVLGTGERPNVADQREKVSSPVVRCALAAVLVACDSGDFDAGMASARALYDALMASEESLAKRQEFKQGNRG